MVKNTLESVRGIIGVFQLLLAGEFVGGHIHVDVHSVLNTLLPPVGLCPGSGHSTESHDE